MSGASSSRPVQPLDVVERAEAGGRIVVDHASRRSAARTRKLVEVWMRAVRAQTSGRLRRSQRIFGPTDCEVSALPVRASSRSSADRRRQLLDLRRRPAVDAVEHRVHQRRRPPRRPAACRARWRCTPAPGCSPGATPLAATSSRADGRRGRPTSRPRRRARPSRAAAPASGAAASRVATIAPPSSHQHALRLEGADVDAEIVPHVQASRSRLKSGPCRASPASTSAASPSRSARSQTSRAEWV